MVVPNIGYSNLREKFLFVCREKETGFFLLPSPPFSKMERSQFRGLASSLFHPSNPKTAAATFHTPPHPSLSEKEREKEQTNLELFLLSSSLSADTSGWTCRAQNTDVCCLFSLRPDMAVG